ncbi:eukaryotic translation initiation factor 4B isoform X1 [Maniola jurtina]|uniref:eukaryotic translation initiation factor 4B isoform X1 n=1 Tax=Maniola jurtina TaxID=191418 RepID=UPI001E6888CA|nr:eukaryotic translation initiation factor 4B isoform X1 [Maniola jurtina]
MAATGKKSKKTKWIKADATNFIAESTTIPTANNWADSVDEEQSTYSSSQRHRAPVVLPSASRAARGGLAVDDESIPRRPPFIAHISNLPYDVEESAIMELFAGLKINNLRLPKESGRLKGFGDVDFEDRESLVSAMNMPDLLVGGRRIRIEVSTQDNDRRMGRGGRNDRDREYDPERTMGDWRSGPRAVPVRERDGPRERDRDRDRDRERDSSADNKPGGWRDAERPEAARAPYGGRDSYGRDRERDGMASADNKPGAWRDAERPEAARAPYGGRDSYGRDRERDGGRERGYGGRDGFRTADNREGGGGGFGNRESRGFGGRGFGDRERDPPREDSKPRERPKLNLLPRTVPRELEAPTKPADGAPLDDKVPEKVVPKPVPAEKVFGAAKPVDTAAKEREIEERLRKQEEEARKAAEEKERWGRRNDHSGDRRGGARRDDRDRGRDSRSYNRDRRDDDRRDYSKDDRDKRDYSKDSSDRRDYSRDDRDRRDRDDSRRDRDDRDRRDRDDRDRRDKEDRDRRDRDDRDRRDRDDKDKPDDRDRRDYRDDDRRDGEVDRRDRDDDRPVRDDDRRDRDAEDRRDPSPEKKDDEAQRNGRHSRSRDRTDAEDRPMPKLKEQEKPNFVASNKFSFLEDADDGGSD